MNTSPVNEELAKILTVEQLPAMPHSALSVLQLDNDLAKVNINDLVRPIEGDPGLAAQVLKFLNSSYFGFQSTISNVKQGIALVGIRIVKNFVLWKAVFSLIPKSKGGAFDVSMLWQDSLRRAMFARFMLMELRKGDPEIVFAAALLQDMAIPLLLKLKGDDYNAVLQQLAGSEQNVRLSDLEKQTFGWTHAEAGGILGRNWKLPGQLTEMIENHVNIEEAAAAVSTSPENAVVALSAFIPMVARNDWEEQETFMKYLKEMFSCDEQVVNVVFDKVDHDFEQYAIILQVPKPKKQLMDFLVE